MTPILGILASSFFQPTGDYQAIMTATVDSGGASSITFSSIPSTYKHLQIRAIMKSPAGDSYIQFNSDTGSNYSFHYLLGNGSSASAGGFANQTSIGWKTPSSTANVFAASVVDILDYSSTSKYKTTRSLAGDDNNSSGAVVVHSGNWRSTSAISSINIALTGGNSFAQYSQFALYGIKGA